MAGLIATLSGCWITVTVTCSWTGGMSGSGRLVCKPSGSGGSGTRQKAAQDLSSFDASKFVVDFSNSNVGSITTINPTATVTLDNSGSAVVSSVVPLVVSGKKLLIQNTISFENWLLSNLGSFDSISVSFSDIEFDGNSGSNNVVGEGIYDGVVLAGGSDSYYNNNDCSYGNCQQF